MAARIVGALRFRGRARPGLGGKPLLLFDARLRARGRGYLLCDAPLLGERVGLILGAGAFPGARLGFDLGVRAHSRRIEKSLVGLRTLVRFFALEELRLPPRDG